MNSIATILLLLDATIRLLNTLGHTPNAPETLKQNVILLARQAITISQNLILQKSPVIIPSGKIGNSETGTILNNNYRILPKPSYDFSEIERITHSFINNERINAGLTPLHPNDKLRNVARSHSEDQARDNQETTDIRKPCAYAFIRHEGLTDAGFTLRERLLNASIDYLLAAENIVIISYAKNFVYRAREPVICPEFDTTIPQDALTEHEKKLAIKSKIEAAKKLLSTIPEVQWINQEWFSQEELAKNAVNGWMNSPGHKANILNPGFTETGIGIANVNEYFIITQVFAGK